MISVEQAVRCVLESARRRQRKSSERFAVGGSWPVVLAEDLHAERDLPPYNRIMMDGIAIRYSDYEQGCRLFTCSEMLVPGQRSTVRLDAQHCFEVMTGAALPDDADTVIRFEDLRVTSQSPKCFEIQPGSQVFKGQSVHPQGSDCREGDLVLKSGQIMGAARWAVASSVGREFVLGVPRVRVAVLSTGDELVAVHSTPGPFEIRASNPFALTSYLEALGCVVTKSLLVEDKKDALIQVLEGVLPDHDIVVLSGGVSAGRFDHVPEVLKELGVQQGFHQVAQRPGKPLWFGDSKWGLVFGLPGNPVSVLVCALRYLQVAITEMQGLCRHVEKLPLATELNLSGKGAWTRFVPVIRQFNPEGECVLLAQSLGTSGDLVQLARSDGFLECGPHADNFAAGEKLPFYPFEQRTGVYGK